MEMPPQPKVTGDKAYYDQEICVSLEAHEEWMREIESYFNTYSSRLDDVLVGTAGVVAELGAGSCGLSACLSKMPAIRRITALDISFARMERMIEMSIGVLGGDREKITPVSGDFNRELPFNDGELDAIFFDASLHHSRSMWDLLSECRRALRPGGLLIAQREACLSSLRAGSQIRRLLRTPEIAANVSENIYLKEQYVYYLTVHGFDVEFIPFSPGRLKRILSPLNGILFADGVLFSMKLPD